MTLSSLNNNFIIIINYYYYKAWWLTFCLWGATKGNCNGLFRESLGQPWPTYYWSRPHELQTQGPEPEPTSRWRLALVVPKGTMQAAKGGKQPTVLPMPMNHGNDQQSTIILGYGRSIHPCPVTDSSVVGLKAHLARRESCLALETSRGQWSHGSWRRIHNHHLLKSP